MIGTIAQTFPTQIDPSPWTNFLYAASGFIVALTAFLTLWRRINGVKDRQDVQETNTQTLAGAALANAKAINASPGPNVPRDVMSATESIRNDPAAPSPLACNTDPIQPPQPRIQT